MTIVKSKHPDYHRYLSLVQRCYFKGDRLYHRYGGKGITVCDEWHPKDPSGFYNFANWFNQQLVTLSITNKSKVRVSRKDKTLGYCPNNCTIVSCSEAVQSKSNVVFSFDLVKEMRDYARSNPTLPLNDIAIKFDQTCTINISRALRGVTWKNVNPVSPPIKKKLNQYRFANEEAIV